MAAFKDVQFVSYDKNGFTVRGRMQLPGVPHSTVMEVLTDYPACASVFRNITSCSAQLLPSGNKRVSQVRWQQADILCKALHRHMCTCSAQHWPAVATPLVATLAPPRQLLQAPLHALCCVQLFRHLQQNDRSWSSAC